MHHNIYLVWIEESITVPPSLSVKPVLDIYNGDGST